MQMSTTVVRRQYKPRFFYIGVVLILLISLVGSVLFFAIRAGLAGREIGALRDQVSAAEELLERTQLEAQTELDGRQAMIASQQAELAAKEEELGQLQDRINQLQNELEQAQMKNPNQKVAYLTFDDGPSAHTPELLNILKEQNVSATFFVMSTKYPQYMKDIVEQGHAIGLHTYSHRYSEIYKSVDAYFKDLDRIAALVKEQTGQTTELIRFAGGSSNLVSRKYAKGIMTTLAEEVAERGYRYFDWNCDSSDAVGKNIPAVTLLKNVKAGVGNKKSVCVLMHDSDGKETTLEALPQIIEYLRDEGYVFATLEQTQSVFHHRVQN